MILSSMPLASSCLSSPSDQEEFFFSSETKQCNECVAGPHFWSKLVRAALKRGKLHFASLKCEKFFKFEIGFSVVEGPSILVQGLDIHANQHKHDYSSGLFHTDKHH